MCSLTTLHTRLEPRRLNFTHKLVQTWTGDQVNGRNGVRRTACPTYTAAELVRVSGRVLPTFSPRSLFIRSGRLFTCLLQQIRPPTIAMQTKALGAAHPRRPEYRRRTRSKVLVMLRLFVRGLTFNPSARRYLLRHLTGSLYRDHSSRCRASLSLCCPIFAAAILYTTTRICNTQVPLGPR